MSSPVAAPTVSPLPSPNSPHRPSAPSPSPMAVLFPTATPERLAELTAMADPAGLARVRVSAPPSAPAATTAAPEVIDLTSDEEDAAAPAPDAEEQDLLRIGGWLDHQPSSPGPSLTNRLEQAGLLPPAAPVAPAVVAPAVVAPAVVAYPVVAPAVVAPAVAAPVAPEASASGALQVEGEVLDFDLNGVEFDNWLRSNTETQVVETIYDAGGIDPALFGVPLVAPVPVPVPASVPAPAAAAVPEGFGLTMGDVVVPAVAAPEAFAPAPASAPVFAPAAAAAVVPEAFNFTMDGAVAPVVAAPPAAFAPVGYPQGQYALPMGQPWDAQTGYLTQPPVQMNGGAAAAMGNGGGFGANMGHNFGGPTGFNPGVPVGQGFGANMHLDPVPAPAVPVTAPPAVPLAVPPARPLRAVDGPVFQGGLARLNPEIAEKYRAKRRGYYATAKAKRERIKAELAKQELAKKQAQLAKKQAKLAKKRAG